MKVLFLDVDGVINIPAGMDPNLLENLRGVIETTGAKIVLSSDWRRTATARAEIRRILRYHNMDYISCTPCHKAFPIWRRPEEILEWIDTHNARCRKEGRPASELVEQWVAVDDRPLLAEAGGRGMVGHFVQTHMSRGITKLCAKRCVDILSEGASASAPAGAAAGGSGATSLLAAAGKPTPFKGTGASLGASTHASFSRTTSPAAQKLLVPRVGITSSPTRPSNERLTPSYARQTGAGVRYQ